MNIRKKLGTVFWNAIIKILNPFLRRRARVNREVYSRLLEDMRGKGYTLAFSAHRWVENRKQLMDSIRKEDIRDFLNWDVIQSTMCFEAPRIEWNAVRKNHIFRKALVESEIGNPRPYVYHPKTSGTLVHHAYSVAQILKKISLNAIDQIIEFGGGYGSMCRLFRKLQYHKLYSIIDIPEFLALQKYFLSSLGPSFFNNTEFLDTGRPLTLISGNRTLFIATWSFSETPFELRSQWIRYLKFDYCLIAFQAKYEGMDNCAYFNTFQHYFPKIDFTCFPIEHLESHYYLIGVLKR